MKALRGFKKYCLVAVLAVLTAPVMAEEDAFKTIEWVELIPAEDLEVLMNPPEYITNVEDGSMEDQISSQIQNTLAAADNDRYQQALVSTQVNAEMDGAMVRVPGFIVPLEFNEQQVVTQFFLVPYFGACLHMPPPPPNQIILVNSPQGVEIEGLGAPYWVRGKLSTTISDNEIATSAYALALHDYELYTE
ncbi:hypothetical protein BST95_10480 [Halioglobus japonicus]|uniref:DUF3299 domain-containing protein n=1 Tax=Halioglobus japonicus TaxID=930805 RepID=A0AAP8MEZ5_9GAMM|nr:DUF3299 domain-containing protein [Halioglobus japonicus]AQA18597.1 hypothetical protein BST95_10480 [Halioglobus japonicus]PLW86621.1 DUF3299 domain-containing protein [Halioglobus japonicus]GHD11921.1 hypothetical protein GCM10007052_12190 [Halioglobus japonicus]